jgi:(1->4)-alpha-D-glucan 1-alpha-D-glucosylmutase
LADDWGVDGTSGYDFMEQVSALQHDAEGEGVLNEFWSELIGRNDVFDVEETKARAEVLQLAFAGQLAACANAFADLAQSELATRDLTSESFRRVLVAFISHYRRYRGYATGADDGYAIDPAAQSALQSAREQHPSDAATVDFIAAVMEGHAADAQTRGTPLRILNQLTAPVAAKAVEDTAFYRFSRLLSRTDVGFDANRFSIGIPEFLQSGEQRALRWGRSMLTTATHDHKRGEDVRARLAVISEVAAEWRDAVREWLAVTAPNRPEIIAIEDAYSLFQTMVGAWPMELAPDEPAGLDEFRNRLLAWREKSLREAKLRSSWAAPDLAYESAHAEWITELLDPGKSPAFLNSLSAFVARVSPAGAVNGVVQAAIRCTWPGIPDQYQGAELWDLSLVDPDNRRAVDFRLREQLLQSRSLDWLSGAVKQSITARLLQWRRADSELFTTGALHALPVRGKRAGNILSFCRQAGQRIANVAVMMHVAEPMRQLGSLPSTQWWGNTEVQIDNVWRHAAGLFADCPVYAAPATVGTVENAGHRLLA